MPNSKLKRKYSDLKEDERCIYQAVGDMEGGDPDWHCKHAIENGAKEVDDEAAMVVLAKYYKYDGPFFATGSEFDKLAFKDVTKILAICTGSRLKSTFVKATPSALAKILMDPGNTEGVFFHAIGIKIVKGSRVVCDQQEIRKNGPFPKDDVIYWKK